MGDWYYGNDGRWHHDPAAPSPGQQPAVTMIRPSAPPEPRGEEPAGDVGDWVDPNAADPTPEEITHPDHVDYVEPWHPA